MLVWSGSYQKSININPPIQHLLCINANEWAVDTEGFLAHAINKLHVPNNSDDMLCYFYDYFAV